MICKICELSYYPSQTGSKAHMDYDLCENCFEESGAKDLYRDYHEQVRELREERDVFILALVRKKVGDRVK